MTAIIYLLIANTIAHIISFTQLKKANNPNKNGVLVFVFINALLAILFWQQVSWVKYLAVILPLLGALALFISTIIKGKGVWIDYVLLVLDIAIIAVALSLIF